MKEVTLHYGGLALEQLYNRFERNNICLNDYAQCILKHPNLTLTQEKKTAVVTIVSVADIGLVKGGSLSDIFSKAYAYHLIPCTLEMAIYFRLNNHQQINSSGIKSIGKAPAGAITIASNPLEESDDFPKGLYVRRIDHIDWLRGYICDDLHVFSPDDRFLFQKNHFFSRKRDDSNRNIHS